MPDEQYGNIVAAAVVTSAPVATHELALFLEGLLADYKRPARIVDVGELPRNQNGKVVTNEVRDVITSLLNGSDGQQ